MSVFGRVRPKFWRPAPSYKVSNAIATSITRLTFERTFDFLRKLRTRADEWERVIYEDPIHTYDDERFLNLNAKVKEALKPIRLWILYNAQLLDKQSVEYIIEAWRNVTKGSL